MSRTLERDSTPKPARHPNRVDPGWGPALACGVVTAVVAVFGVVIGVRAVFDPVGPLQIDWLLPLSPVRLRVDPLGGLFMAVAGAVAAMVGPYTVGYARRERLPGFALAMIPVFVASLLIVPAAGSVTTFLYCWELMAVASLLLVVTDHRRPAVRRAGLVYAVLTQLGFVELLLGLLVLSAAAGADSFVGVAAGAARVGPATRDLVFGLTVLGFGSKAGLLPLHAWLPRAHPEAPSPVSALMSAAMVNMGIYGLIRVDLQLLGPAPRWWGLALLVVGGLSAVFGVLHASVATDLKRLLAYSTTEHMGLVTLALGAALLLAGSGASSVATIALTAALLQVLAHAAFKSLAFLAAGSVLASTGLRDLDRLGGLAARMPVTTVMFGVAALGACGLPLGAGFAGEWLLLQSLVHAPLHGSGRVDTLLALSMPLAMGAVALTIGVGIAAMVKALGVGFLARPRSPAAGQAREAGVSMVGAMALAAAACGVLAVAPGLTTPVLSRVLATLPIGAPGLQMGTYLRLPGGAGSIAPGWLAAALLAATALAVTLAAWGSRRRPAPASLPLWACGAAALTSRMQYTATSFAQPLQRVFSDVLQPETDIDVSHFAESHYLIEKMAYRATVTDAFERHLYRPVVRAMWCWAGWVRRAHPGNIHLYLLYGGLGLLLVLVLAR